MAQRKISFAEHEHLDSDERTVRQPPGPLVELAAEAAPASVVDWGAGTGYFTLPLLRRLPAARVVCVDVEPRMLGVIAARAQETGVDERVGLLEVEAGAPLPLEAGSVDLVLMVNLLHELDQPGEALNEVVRVLVPGGRFLVCDWDPAGDPVHGPSPAHRVPVERAEVELARVGLGSMRRHDLYHDFWVIEASRSV